MNFIISNQIQQECKAIIDFAGKDIYKFIYDYEKPEQIIYTVKGQEVTKAEYSAYTKKIIKNESGKSFSKLKWKRY